MQNKASLIYSSGKYWVKKVMAFKQAMQFYLIVTVNKAVAYLASNA
jgi:hypothetical protein